MAEFHFTPRKSIASVRSGCISFCCAGLLLLSSSARRLSVYEEFPELRKLSHSQIDHFLPVVEKADFEKIARQAKDIFFHKGVWVTQLPDGYELKFAKYLVGQTQHNIKYADKAYTIRRIYYNLKETKSPYRCILLQVEKPENTVAALIQIDAIHNKATPVKSYQRALQDVNTLSEILRPPPVESNIRLQGKYGCIAYFPFEIELKQKGEKIESRGDFISRPVVTSLTYRDFVRIWDILQSPAGSLPKSTADSGATVEIECQTRDGLAVHKMMYLRGIREIRSILAPSTRDNNQ